LVWRPLAGQRVRQRRSSIATAGSTAASSPPTRRPGPGS